MDIELRFVKRHISAAKSASQDSAPAVEVKILQQRIKTGTYVLWGEWHDVPIVEEEDEPEQG